ncbi:MAG: LysR family transcriptional regulator [Betaproteobacteria bacterium]|uniref:LysR family transcriptional regulator n=1 Tax=Thiomonas sp. FB-6 TaxID=1158291 RepID=UPI0003621778|nr:LysR family transcriptional regulator [Thiomonas sp. FB-6]MBU6439789.1 LysR family transcriptional regulator [Betaproteobacteria bacterium]MBU6511690.1 LysR family transcriptional regulator [Betaproteobacteria bacterium]MDE1954563.1 LysR family transcriptional regulator [Betaproteobacteria bacterium]MDE2151604.1 LysR family transcriptional regulator [Betaproteobacteria bacterium]
MEPRLDDLSAFAAVARAGGFRDAARARGTSASSLSEAVRRLEAQLGVRLLNRSTRSVAPTEAGRQLLGRLAPALEQIGSALEQAHASRDRPAGTLRLNVPVAAVRLVLPRLLPEFLAAYPQIRLEIRAEDRFVDILAEGCDAGIRYDERLEQDMVAVPIGPARQRFAAAASTAYLRRAGRPRHPRDLMRHACLRGRFSSGAMPPWEFARDGEVLRLDPQGPLLVGIGAATDLAVDAAVSGVGIVYLFEDWLAPYFERGELEPVLQPWWPSFTGPFLYYPGQRQLPPALRALVDFVKTRRW